VFFYTYTTTDAVDLEEEALMLALLHKKICNYKRRHHYWVHPLLCSGLETGQSQMAGSSSVSFINNSVSNDSRGDCLEVFKNSERDDNTAASRSEQRVTDPFVEMAQMFTKPLIHRSVTRTKNKLTCMYRVSYVSVS
jgi:hypothetical protein